MRKTLARMHEVITAQCETWHVREHVWKGMTALEDLRLRLPGIDDLCRLATKSNSARKGRICKCMEAAKRLARRKQRKRERRAMCETSEFKETVAEDADAKGKKEEPKKLEPENLRTPVQKEANEFKNRGNELYKKKQFAEALEMYDRAIEKESNDLTYYNNKCAVWVEMGEEKYDSVLETCMDLVSRRYEINTASPGGASFEKVAKMLCRMASVHEKRNNYDQAIEMYQKALTEDNSRSTRNALREVERTKENFENETYMDPVKAEETP